ncbi:Glycine/D-amino acid oxidase [Chitinophaga sp. CF118]|uniref:NAD(P)/FAD-dependent oxidoreductase n=1 Tax=Chitinophaga sp. CF118 TaxID=1884367 RepID=UPI0008EBDE39|nr:FAD-binding oxidoreductase [Chitinophaga sp. CF118]SFE30670.1 Glycine/D-amino acid oxidase [Chitinophaga sp. CF118]
MNVDFLIIGQGIAGTLLSHTLLEAGASVLVIDEYRPNSASRIAAGVINPVSGRRFTISWLYDDIYPVAVKTYQHFEQLLGVPVFKDRNIWNVLPSEQLRDAFMERTSGLAYMQVPETDPYEQFLHQPFGAAVIKGATVLLHNLLPAWREYLKEHKSLREERIDLAALKINADGIQYKDISAGRIIFCEGAQTISNPWFNQIPFLLNKGEVLRVRIPGFNTEDIIKRSITLVPQSPETYWVGSTFAWDYPDEMPTPEKREYLEAGLQQLLKVPYEILEQQAGVRPSGTDRRPIMGLHPEYPALGIFNGLGTKGTSLAPAMAAQFAAYLLRNEPLQPETDIKRFFNRRKG